MSRQTRQRPALSTPAAAETTSSTDDDNDTAELEDATLPVPDTFAMALVEHVGPVAASLWLAAAVAEVAGGDR